ncbi:MAG: 5'/3'-nucleotidase SurE [Bacilli bacterium]|jgi:5'-nucleotidase|nr:5'/3'-nucleotidase SurE [Bacilli bacterium]MDD2681873.1 5'/3'-nucleotidase SurE [Bacilli bacterium]MDD3120800.1 5'/3'-nucleotidase SurE [Bacilli bacterium]MDD4062995.1 5'/3'-nucleotidase SurE [Bacilli bacterium]MDD4481725.1 5'/3'-nucleotidase SurE [Bacilli bacterium]
MRILITNDDGIEAEGIKILVELSKKYGEVFVVAPYSNQSATSHKININGGFKAEEYFGFEEVKAYKIDSTPADCVRFAEYYLKIPFDVVFSGINKGFNLGFDMFYSGTVAGATEAAYYGKKGISFSSFYGNFSGVLENFDDLMTLLLKEEIWNSSQLFNVNFPERSKGIKFTIQGDTHFETTFLDNDGHFYQKGKPCFIKDETNLLSDVNAIINNYISVTPIIADKTNFQALKNIKR